MDRRKFIGAGAGLLSAFLLNPTKAFSWGAFTVVKNTHRLIVENALSLIREKEPVFRRYSFPATSDIVKHDYVSWNPVGGMYGTGPDADGNSPYSHHYYNPHIKQGGGPYAVKLHFERLLQAMVQNPHGSGAAGAASWAAHFLADMHVPYHVVGIPWQEANRRHTKGYGRLSQDESGPLSLYNGTFYVPKGWGRYKDFTYALNVYIHYSQYWKHKDHDWYDPWYYNGHALRAVEPWSDAQNANADLPLSEKSAIFGSSHVLWEATFMWLAYKAKVIYRELTQSGFYDPSWKNMKTGPSNKFWTVVGNQAALFAKGCAYETRTGIEQYLNDSLLSVCRAIRSVATLYRASVSAISLEYQVGQLQNGYVPITARAYNLSLHDILYDVDFIVEYTYRGVRERLFKATKSRVHPGQYVSIVIDIPARSHTNVKVDLAATGMYKRTPDACYVSKEIILQGGSRPEQQPSNDQDGMVEGCACFKRCDADKYPPDMVDAVRRRTQSPCDYEETRESCIRKAHCIWHCDKYKPAPQGSLWPEGPTPPSCSRR